MKLNHLDIMIDPCIREASPALMSSFIEKAVICPMSGAVIYVAYYY